MTRARTGYQRGVEAGYAQGYHAGYQVAAAAGLDARTITEDMRRRACQAALAAYNADGYVGIDEIVARILEAALTPKEQ